MKKDKKRTIKQRKFTIIFLMQKIGRNDSGKSWRKGLLMIRRHYKAVVLIRHFGYFRLISGRILTPSKFVCLCGIKSRVVVGVATFSTHSILCRHSSHPRSKWGWAPVLLCPNCTLLMLGVPQSFSVPPTPRERRPSRVPRAPNPLRSVMSIDPSHAS